MKQNRETNPEFGTANLQAYEICQLCNCEIGIHEMGRHVHFKHNTKYNNYVLKYVYNNNTPHCQCGCNEEIDLIKGLAACYKKGHHFKNKEIIEKRSRTKNSEFIAQNAPTKQVDFSGKKKLSDEQKSDLSQKVKDFFKNKNQLDLPKKECKICNELINEGIDFGNHIRKHKIPVVEYIVKYECGGVWPVCECGCGNKVEIRKGRIQRFCHGHAIRVPEIAKRAGDMGREAAKNIDCRKKNSDAIKEKWKDDDYRKRVCAGISMSGKLAYKNGTRKVATFSWSFIKHCTQQHSITQKYEQFDSGLELSFSKKLAEMGIIAEKNETKSIQYFDSELNERNYFPDFFIPEFKMVIETKGMLSHTDPYKFFAARQFYINKGFDYRVLTHRDLNEFYNELLSRKSSP